MDKPGTRNFSDPQMAEITRLIAEMAGPDSAWQEICAEQARLAREFGGLLQEITKQVQEIGAAFYAPLNMARSTFATDRRSFELIEASGWLPHYTTPFESVEGETDSTIIGKTLADFYEGDWESVRARFASAVDRCTVDDEAKATFREALAAHGAGLYRCAPRLLFPEIERVVRDEFYPNDLQTRLASQPQLIEAVSDLPGLEVTERFVAGLWLYRKLARHLYTKVNTAEALALVRDDPVPNRHAALHGLAVYKTQQNSLNTIIMTEFTFELVALFKDYESRLPRSTAA